MHRIHRPGKVNLMYHFGLTIAQRASKTLLWGVVYEGVSEEISI